MKKFLTVVLFLFAAHVLYAEISVEYFGGAQRVSGSCALVKTDNGSVIVDCGAFYDEDGLEADNTKINPAVLKADALVLTHAHADHAGLIPLLINSGFKGNIYCTAATKKILFEVYEDGWNFEDVKEKYFWSLKQRLNCREKQRGTVTLHWFENCKKSLSGAETLNRGISQRELKKIYNVNFRMCKKCTALYLKSLENRFIEIKYGDIIGLSEFISFSLSDAGHIPGSASVLFTVKDGDRVKKIVFSGDLGSKYSKLVTLRQNCKQTDAVFVESTYGGNPRKILFSDYGKFYMDLKRELESGKIVWIPALSLQRTQKVLYEIKKIKDNGAIDAEIPVYSLSPSSNGLTELYENEIKNPSFEKWFMPFIYEGGGIIPDNYKTKKAKKYPKPCIILSASGMMDKGVSLSLLGKLLPREDVSVFLVSYASPQTPAGQLKKGGKTVRTKYGKIKVKASVETFDVFSDHADITEISLWLDKKTNKNASVFLVHGEKKSLDSSKKFLTDYGFTNVSEVYPCKKIIVK